MIQMDTFIQQKLAEAISAGDRTQADIFYDLAFEYVRFNETQVVHLVLDSQSACKLIAQVTHDEREDLVFVGGIVAGDKVVLGPTLKVTMTKRSVGSAAIDGGYTAKALTTLREQEYPPLIVGHSHPGFGQECTHPSQTDRDWIKGVQATSKILGIIVTRDGWLRVFTDRVPFTISVQGKNIKKVSHDVCKITI